MDGISLRASGTGRVDENWLPGGLLTLKPASRAYRFLSEGELPAQNLALTTTVGIPRFTATALGGDGKAIWSRP